MGRPRLTSRSLQVFESIGDREPSFLSTAPWLQRMRSASTQPARDDLKDIMARIPWVMQEFDLLRASDPSKVELSDLLRVLGLYSKVKDDLAYWRLCVGVNTETYYQPSVILDSQLDGHLSQLIPRTRRYYRVIDAIVNLSYLAAQLVLQLEMMSLCSFTDILLSRQPPAPENSVDNDSSADKAAKLQQAQDPARALRLAKRYCNEILESIEQLLLPASGVLAAGTVVFPMMVSMHFLGSQQDPRQEYMMTLIKRFQQRSGCPLADIVEIALGIH